MNINPMVKATFKGQTPSSSIELHITLDKATEYLTARIPTESVILMRHAVLDGEAYEYYAHSMRVGRVHITVEPLIHADS